MSRPRFSIGGLMLVVALAAANFGMFRASADGWAIELVIGLYPFLNLLLIGVVLLLVGLVRTGQGSAFWLGFVEFGFAGLLAVMVDIARGVPFIAVYWNAITNALEGAVGRNIETSPDWTLLSVMPFTICMSLPLVLFSVLGGCVTCNLGIIIVRRRRSETPREGALA